MSESEQQVATVRPSLCEARAQPRTVLLCCVIELDSDAATFASVAFYEVTRLAVSSKSYKFIMAKNYQPYSIFNLLYPG